jgi:copper chaperone NosL
MKRALLFALLLAACASGPPAAATLDTKNESCAWCRMAISDARFAAQIVAPSEEPRFFDDVGCLAHFAADEKARRPGAVAYVADHRKRTWVRADAALYTEVASLATPMGSHLMAHADRASRDADLDAKGGTARTPAQVFGPGGAPGGAR